MPNYYQIPDSAHYLSRDYYGRYMMVLPATASGFLQRRAAEECLTRGRQSACLVQSDLVVQIPAPASPRRGISHTRPPEDVGGAGKGCGLYAWYMQEVRAMLARVVLPVSGAG